MKHTQKFPRSIRRPPSAAQRRRRNAFRKCVNFWHTSVSDSDRLEWENYAYNHPIRTRRGQHAHMTAYQAFIRINLYRACSGVKLVTSPPND